jgi:hypothetical protein
MVAKYFFKDDIGFWIKIAGHDFLSLSYGFNVCIL